MEVSSGRLCRVVPLSDNDIRIFEQPTNIRALCLLPLLRMSFRAYLTALDVG